MPAVAPAFFLPLVKLLSCVLNTSLKRNAPGATRMGSCRFCFPVPPCLSISVNTCATVHARTVMSAVRVVRGDSGLVNQTETMAGFSCGAQEFCSPVQCFGGTWRGWRRLLAPSPVSALHGCLVLCRWTLHTALHRGSAVEDLVEGTVTCRDMSHWLRHSAEH